MKGLPRSLGRGASAATVAKVNIPIRNVAVAVADGAPGFGTVVIGDLPEGNILLQGAVAYMQFQTADADVIATFDGDYGIGTTATADNAIAGTDVNVIPSTALGAATAKLSPIARGANATAVMLDNTDGSLELNLNLLIDDASISGAASFTVNGVLVLVYAVLGDD